MKRLLTIALSTAIIATPASALAQNQKPHNELPSIPILTVDKPAVLPIIKLETKKVEKPKKVEPPKPVVYTVVEGDSLTKIGTAHKVEWQRLWAKNTQLTSPDRINVGEKLTIPEPSEQLSREIPVQVSLPAVTPGVAPQRGYSAYSAGNAYTPRNCTWYSKSRRPDLPNNLGNANTWVARAAAQGIPTGSTPRAGAIGQQGMHVVYIEQVDGARVYLSEMNYDYNGGFRYRWANASDFQYIY